jgi:hypothetical protein
MNITRLKTAQVALGLLLTLLAGCADPPSDSTSQTPMRDDVPPIRNTAITVIVNLNLTYNAQDQNGAVQMAPQTIVDRLNSDGSDDGNTFSVANGVAENFTLNYTINSTGQNRYAGSVVMSGWGWGNNIHTFDSGQYDYDNGADVVMALTDSVYGYIHTGWHDARKDQ